MIPLPSPACQAELSALIRARTGIVIQDHQRANLELTAREACNAFGLSSCEQLAERLANSAPSAPLMEYLVSRITVGESYFFRDPVHVAFLRTHWLPRTLAAKRAAGDWSLRVWSAGCSDGQEIRTLSILLDEALPDRRGWHLHLLGADIDTEALSRAVVGIYPAWSFRATPEAVRERYFEPVAKGWRIKEPLRSLPRFAYLNLTEDSFPSIMSQTNALDLIFCRNVFIYFHHDTVARILERMSACLAPGGHLLVGASDLILEEVPGCVAEQHGDCLVYRRLRPDEGVVPAPVWPLPTEAPAPPHRPAPRVINPPPTERTQPDIVQLLHDEAWETALEAIGKLPKARRQDPMLQQFEAKARANLGQTAASLALCRSCLAATPTDKHAWLIQGLVQMEAGQLKEAEASLRRGIFLDLGFVECRYQLGLLLLQRGQREEGLKNLKLAQGLAKQGKPEWRLHNTAGMTYQRLATTLQAEIGLYSR